jgi:methylase of polypeptide subunit release factors
MRYTNTGINKENGVVYTPIEMANYVAREMLKYYKGKIKDEIYVLDPAAGEGNLLIAILNQLYSKASKINVVGYETDCFIALKTQRELQKLFPTANIKIHTTDFIEAVEKGEVKQFDFVIANPPYIRTQIMGSERAQKIAEKLSLKGRIDIYYAFLLYTKNVLKSSGIAGYITSNKFMTIKAGASVRNYMLQNYQLHHITDLGDTRLFSAAVLPCIVIFSQGQTVDKTHVNFTSVYQSKDYSSTTKKMSDIFEKIYSTGIYSIDDSRCFQYRQGKLQSVEMNSLWTISSDTNEKWLKKVESNTWMTFSELGKIRVGIKTTADNVFIGDDWNGEKSDLELLLPLITHRNAGQIVANNNSQWKVLYTHTIKNGKKVAYNIEKYPKTKAYLMQHYEQLSSRSYIKKANRNWYEIWVPQNPEAWKHRKIIFRDISEHPQFWLDETGAVINGDCYWIDILPEVMEDVIYLALAVANSKFIEKYYDVKFNTKLYSGKRRYQTQYVKAFPIPYYDSELARKVIRIVKKIITERNDKVTLSYKNELDLLVEKIFNN